MSSHKSRTRTKTFTGCWTCRKRKVKCDEARPSCQQCLAKNLSCAGYASRLQWLAPQATAEAPLGAQMPTTYRMSGMSLRRQITQDESLEILPDAKLDSYLEQIETDCPDAGSPTVSRGPFSVFSYRPDSESDLTAPTQASSSIWEATDACTSLSCPTENIVLTPTDQLATLACHSITPDVTPDNTTIILPVDDQSVPSWTSDSACQELVLGPPQLGKDDELFLGLQGSDTPEETNSQSSGGQGGQQLVPSGQTDVDYSVPVSKRFFHLPSDVEHLLHHYIHHVVDLMTVVPTPEGPWKTVHLPRALQGSAELAFVGKTSHACNALFHALLTISAYNLAANFTIIDQNLQANKWRELAMRLKARSLTFLRASLRPDCPASERGKYKEVLAAMLSMVTIDVCSGETSTSEWHLKGLESFIRTSQRDGKNGYSRRTQELHRVYVYLRIIRESTDLRYAGLARSNTKSEPYQGLSWLSKPPFPPDFIKDSPDRWLQARPPYGHIDMSACEFIYGIPFQLITLLGRTSDLIRRKRAFVSEFPNSALPEELSAECDDLESEIFGWPIEEMVERLCELPINKTSQQLIEHQTRAFHEAMIIYFSQLLRSVHRKHLQPYVEHVINYLETIEVIKNGANIETGCVLWPGFVGAAEAMDAKIQSRYLQWFKSIRFYGLGAYDKACEVVMEVWERQKSDNRQSKCSWLAVVEDNNVRLMIT